jgi:preprotein translocase subunit SecG
MHMGRIITIIGSVIAVVSLFIQKANSEGEAALAALSQANPAFPADLDENTIEALYNDTSWAAILFGIAAIAAFVVAVLPPIKDPMKRVMAITATAMGAIMLVVGIVATVGAQNDASDLEAAFNQAAEAGAIPVAFTVSLGYGWYILIFAGALVALGGIMGLMTKTDTAS